MTGHEISILIKHGAIDNARKKLKRLSIPDRLRVLNDCVPYVNATPEFLKFFKDNFAVEIGAIIAAENNLEKAVLIYCTSKSYK